MEALGKNLDRQFGSAYVAGHIISMHTSWMYNCAEKWQQASAFAAAS